MPVVVKLKEEELRLNAIEIKDEAALSMMKRNIGEINREFTIIGPVVDTAEAARAIILSIAGTGGTWENMFYRHKGKIYGIVGYKK